jgi:hypothetical protein
VGFNRARGPLLYVEDTLLNLCLIEHIARMRITGQSIMLMRSARRKTPSAINPTLSWSIFGSNAT